MSATLRAARLTSRAGQWNTLFMRAADHQFALLGSLWLLLVVVEIFSHSYIPIDETRYVSVAWNMWLSGDYLVPTLNGEAYSHKPPLLFWLMNLGWAVFGVSDWWPRLVPALFALGSVRLTMRLAARLWPQQPQVVQYAPLILFGSALWTVFTTATMFDMLLAFFTLLGMLGVVLAWQERRLQGWLLFAIAIAGGLLAKGPAIFLHVLPIALLAPWWGRGTMPRWGRWYLGVAAAVALGLAIALAWAIPAGLRGGEEYRQAIFWGQTAHRMVESFAHQRPFWWYLPLLPLMFFPWLLWRPLWQGAAHLQHAAAEPGVRFCLAWLVPVFATFSLISGKQVHYLLPVFPAFALLAARALQFAPVTRHRDGMLVLLAVVTAAMLLLYLPFYARTHAAVSWLEGLPAWTALVLGAGSAGLWLTSARQTLAKVWSLALISVLLASLLNLGVIRAAGSAYDMRPIASRLKRLEQGGVPLAHVGEYPGTFNFVGRLHRSPQILQYGQLDAWFAAHPQGRAVVYFSHKHPPGELQPEFLQNYLGMQVGIINRSQWRAWCASNGRGC